MSKRKSLKDFKSVVKQIASHRPVTVPKKPDKAPSADQLKQGWKLVRR